jgi:hypothetical protein
MTCKELLQQKWAFNTFILRYELSERRQSTDYRIYKKEEDISTFENLTNFNTIKDARVFKRNEWKKIGETRYGDEDVVILQNKKW